MDGTLRLRTTPSPFAGLSRAQVDGAFARLSADNQRIYTRSLGQLRRDLVGGDPELILSGLAVYQLLQPGGVDAEIAGKQPLLPIHTEFVQAVALTHRRCEYHGPLPPDPGRVQRVIEGVRAIAEAWKYLGFSSTAAGVSDTERARFMAQARIRGHTAAVRNCGFPEQVARIVSELFAPLDGRVESRIGLRPSHVFGMLSDTTDFIEARFDATVRSLGRVFADANSIDELAEAYLAAFPGMVGNAAAFATILRSIAPSLEAAKAVVVAHRELTFPAFFTLSIDDLASSYPGDAERGALEAAVESWSLDFGDLAGEPIDHFFLANPVWSRPFVKLSDHGYFCLNPGLLHSFGLELVEGLIEPHPDLLEKYQERRARYLEQRVEDLFRTNFPSAKVFAGSKWKDASGEGENDLLVILDDHAVVVECKSGKVTDRAMRGHPGRLKDTARKLVAEPTHQGRRFVDFLLANPGPHRFPTKKGPANVVDVSGVRRFVVMNATLSLFGLLGFRWPVLVEAGFLPAGFVPSPTLSLVDLEILFDVLRGEPRLLHYLVRRSELESSPNVAGDELDLLAHYLRTGGLEAGTLAGDEDTFVDLGLQSKWVDRIVPLPHSDRAEFCPGIRLNRLWRKLLLDLEASGTPGWTSTAMALLDVRPAQQAAISRSFDDVVSKARKATADRTTRLQRVRVGHRSVVVAAFKGLDALTAVAEARKLRATTDAGNPPIVVFARVEGGGPSVIS